MPTLPWTCVIVREAESGHLASIAEIGQHAVVVGQLQTVAGHDTEQLTVCGMARGTKAGQADST